MKKKKKYLPLYYRWLKTNRLPNFGLCNSIGYEVNELFGPTGSYSDYQWCWGYTGEPYSVMHVSSVVLREFTPLRQTIVLFLAAMNDEL